MSLDSSQPGRTVAFSLIALQILALGLLIYPLMVIQPFRHQGESELDTALLVMRWRPYFEIAASVTALVMAIWYCRFQHRIWPRIFVIGAVVIVCSAAALSHVNVYEIMFHHYDRPTYSAAASAKLDGDEKVIAIALHGQARAYPIRSMSYHHVVNDEVGGIPVVATY